MIYKIVGNFDEVDFEKMLDKLSSIFEFIYCDENLFVFLSIWINNALKSNNKKD